MIVIPFLFFFILTIYWLYEHKGVDVCSYMSGLYALTTLFAALLYLSGSTEGTNGEESGGMLWGSWEPTLGFIPTFSFCFLIGVSILPFSYIKVKHISNITLRAPLVVDAISSLLILTAMVIIYCIADSTMEILSGDLNSIRESSYKGYETPAQVKAASLPFPLGHLTYLSYCTTLAMPIMFCNICMQRRAWWWNSLLFFTSLAPIFNGIQRADRTEPIFFALMFVFCIIFFWHSFSNGAKRVMSIAMTILATVGLLYISAVSVARFDDRKNGGAALSAMQYAGQGYLNYCYFCEYATFDKIESEREFPITNHVFAHIDSNGDRRGERSAHQGFSISVFPTFIGDILLDLTPIGLLLWVASYSLFCTTLIRWKDRNTFDVSEILILFIVSAVPIFGIFYYRYHGWAIALNFVFVLIIWIASKYRFTFTLPNSSDCKEQGIKQNVIYDDKS